MVFKYYKGYIYIILYDISQIKCDICKDRNKSNTFNYEFYICYECKICPLCKSKHDNTHTIINYDNKNNICNKHNEIFTITMIAI